MYMPNSEDKLRIIDPNAKDGGKNSHLTAKKVDEFNEIIDYKVSESCILQ